MSVCFTMSVTDEYDLVDDRVARLQAAYRDCRIVLFPEHCGAWPSGVEVTPGRAPLPRRERRARRRAPSRGVRRLRLRVVVQGRPRHGGVAPAAPPARGRLLLRVDPEPASPGRRSRAAVSAGRARRRPRCSRAVRCARRRCSIPRRAGRVTTRPFARGSTPASSASSSCTRGRAVKPASSCATIPRSGRRCATRRPTRGAGRSRTRTSGSTSRTSRSRRHIAGRLADLIERELPIGATVAVASKGDESLVHDVNRCPRHFPADESGDWAGFHPADSDEAIALLERERLDGVDHFALPETGDWWLEHYGAFAEHLASRGRLVAHAEGAGWLWELQ